MKTNWQHWVCKLWIAMSLVAGVASSLNSASAQITPDSTLGTESSVVKPLNPLIDRIDGGAVRGFNLFHSFQDFNIGEGRGAYFANPTGITNIFSRVTGSNPSQLLGTLGVYGNANLFFLNPNGIIFGPNAKLDMGGSFVASTANSVIFPDGKKFSASNPEMPPLLTINVSAPVGLEFASEKPGAIVNSGDLGVGAEQNLTLAGGTVVSTGKLSAPSGELAVVTVPGIKADGSTPVVNIGQTGQFVNWEMQRQTSGSSQPAISGLTLSELLANTDSITGLKVNNNGQVELAGSNLPVQTGDVAVRELKAQTATLTAEGNLTLVESKLGTMENLNLLAKDTVRVRDSVANPVIAAAGNKLLLQGNQGVDIFALNHSESGLFSGGDMVLRSADKVGGDAHYYAGGNFRIEKLDGSLGNLYSPHDPVIRALGDVFINAYEGESLHIIAGGKVEIPEYIFITDADPDYGIVETITLSNGETVNIDGQNKLTVDIRAGVTPDAIGIPIGLSGTGSFFAPAFFTGDPTSADIVIGDIYTASLNSDGGRVFLTNQYKSNTALNGAITANYITTSGDFGGGLVTLDSRGDITLKDSIFAIDYSSRSNGKDMGGNVNLIANGNITTRDINSWSINSNSGTIDIISHNGSIDTTLGTLDSTSAYANGGNIILEAKNNINLGEITNLNNNDDSNSFIQMTAGSNIILNGDVTSNGEIDIAAGQNIVINDIFYDSLNFGVSNSSVKIVADADNNGIGNFVMQDTNDTLKTSGRDISISGASLTVGRIDTTRSIKDKAGQLLETAQDISNNLGIPLTSISGTLSNTQDVDLFQIFLTGDSTFSANVNSTNNVAYLSLFDSNGLGIYSNYNDINDLSNSTKSPTLPANYSLTPTKPGIYYLAVSNQGNSPLSNQGKIFSQKNLSGATGEGSAFPLSNWNNKGDTFGGFYSLNSIAYNINLTGVKSSDSTFTEPVNVKSGNITLIANNGDINVGILDEFNQPPTMNINTSGVINGGNIFIKATGKIIINDNVDASGYFGNGGDIFVKAIGDININVQNVDRSILSFGYNGIGGKIAFISQKDINIAQPTPIDYSEFFPHKPFNLFDFDTVNSENFTISSNSFTNQDIKGSTVLLSANNIKIGTGIAITSSGFGNAIGGDIIVNASNSFIIDADNNPSLYTGLYSAGTGSSLNNSGDIFINTKSIDVLNGGQIFAGTPRQGNGGNIIINSTEYVLLDGRIPGINVPSQINTQARRFDSGNGGNILINTPHLQITNGAVLNSSTRGNGEAGDISITANSVLLNNNGIIFTVVNNEGIGKGGNIHIQTDSFLLNNNSLMLASSIGNGDAGNIEINANNFEVNNNSQISTNTTTNNNAGTITLNIEKKAILAGDNSGLFAQTESSGNAGDIIFNTSQLSILDGATISAFTTNIGDGGSITINSPEFINLGGNSKLSVETSSVGKAGNINLTTNLLTVEETARITATATETATTQQQGGSITINSPSLNLFGKVGIFAQTQGEVPAGKLTIQPSNNQPNLDINFAQGAEISASTSGSGQGGSIFLTAPQSINIQGDGKVSVETTGKGNAGNINVTTQNFKLSNNAQITASTSSSGQGGNINLFVDNDITLTDNNTTITASTLEGSSGNGGSIFIDPITFTIANGAKVAVNSQGTGTGGDIEIYAGTLTLDEGTISSITKSTDGGNISLYLDQLLFMRKGSEISTTAGDKQFGGNGGNININAPFIVAFPTENSDITANAFQGQGGNIQISTQAIFGLEYRPSLTPYSDITASSEFGLDGQVVINTPGIDPSRGLTPLPDVPVNTQIVVGCQAGGVQSSVSFTNAGRRGLPTRPDDPLTEETIIADWINPDFDTKNTSFETTTMNLPKSTANSNEATFKTQLPTVISPCYAN